MLSGSSCRRGAGQTPPLAQHEGHLGPQPFAAREPQVQMPTWDAKSQPTPETKVMPQRADQVGTRVYGGAALRRVPGPHAPTRPPFTDWGSHVGQRLHPVHHLKGKVWA